MDKPKRFRVAPTSTVSNSWGTVTGATAAHLAVADIRPDGTKYIQATATGQACILGVTGALESIPDSAAIIGVKVTIIGRSVSAGDAVVRVQPLTPNATVTNTLVKSDLIFHPTAEQVQTVFFSAQEAAAGEYSRWTKGALSSTVSNLRLRLINNDATNNAKITSARVDVYWTEAVSSDNFFSTGPESLGWSSTGVLNTISPSRGVSQITDASATNGYQYYRTASLLTEYGVLGAWFESPAVWPTPATGTAGFCFNALTANAGTSGKFFQVNLLRQSGTDYVGILKGPPASNNPTVDSNYLTKVAFPWGSYVGPFGIWLYWDSANVYVYAGDNYDTALITVARSSLSAGIGGGSFLQFGTQVDSVGGSSQGSIRLLRFIHRGFNIQADSKVVLDWQTRKDLAGASGFQTSTIIWHHSGITFDAYKVRYGGSSNGTGFYIPAVDGASNTEGTAVSIGPNQTVLTVISHGALKINDVEDEGARFLQFYVRDSVTKVWSVYQVDALQVDINFFRDVPVVAAKDFLVGTDTKVSVSASREFYVLPAASALPGGKTQAADVEFRTTAGSTATLVTSPDAGTVDVTGLQGITADCVGRAFTMSGAASAVNNVRSLVTLFISSTSVRIANASAVAPDANNGSLHWEIGRGILTSTVAVPEAHQDGLPGIATEQKLDLDAGVALDRDGLATLSVLVVDAFGQQSIQLISVSVRRDTPFESTRGDAGYRFAMPPEVRDRDRELSEKYLPVWDAVAFQGDKIFNSMKDLLSPQTAPLNSLQLMFQEMGLIYPSVPGYPEAALRRLLDNADAIHRSRFTLLGLRFYLSLLIPNAQVEITGFPRGFFIFLSSLDATWPTLDMIITAGTADDVCTYLFNVADFFTPLTITVTGVSPIPTEIQEFVRATIRREIPMSDDPDNPRPITIVFLP